MEKHTISAKDSVVFGKHQGTSMIWSVLDIQGDSALILSDISVRVSEYYRGTGPVTWHQSEIRKWLNYDFYGSAFTPEEQKEIVDVQFSDDENEEQLFSQAAFDHVFLLSQDEAERYFSTDEERTLTCPLDDTVGLTECWNGLRTTCPWWLRGHSIQNANRYYAPACGVYGSFVLKTSKARAGVRPAVWVHVSSLRLAESSVPKPPLLGLLKTDTSHTVTVTDFVSEWPNERSILGSFVDYEMGQEYLLIQSDYTSLFGYAPFFAKLVLEPVADKHTTRKLKAITEMLREKPYSRVASEMQMDLYRYLAEKSLKQRAWLSDGYDACPDLQEGSELTFGHDFTTEDHQPYHWRILKRKGNRALVICQQGLCYNIFADDADDIVDADNRNVWKYSQIRILLNDFFYKNAFTKEEKGMIVRYRTEFGDYLGRPGVREQPVYDRCFLLSAAEAAVFFSNDQERQLNQALDSQCWNSSRNSGAVFETHNWWCRSRGSRDGFTAYVKASGSVDPDGASADTEECVVRPALLINLKRFSRRSIQAKETYNEHGGS